MKRWQMVAEVLVLVIAAVVWFATRSQWKLLDPFHTEWMLNGDWAATYHGWLFHLRGPLTLPPGLTPTLLAPWGTSVFYTNSVFWLCEFGRVVGLFVSRDFQLYGLFMASSYAGLAVTGWWLLRRLGAPLVLRLAGGALLMAEPMLPARFGHIALTGQWLVMLQICVAVLLVTEPKRPSWLVHLAAGAAAFAVGVEGYLAAISIPLALANIVIGRWRAQVPWRAVGTSVALLVLGTGSMLWLVGGILADPVNRAAEGFGDFSADLGTLFNSHQLSRWIPGFPVSSRQGEGFSYLGLGTLLLVVTALLAWVTKPKQVLRMAWLLAPLLVMVLGEAFYAASARITFSGQVLVELWGFFKLLEPLPSMFRTSGRFVWALHFLVSISAIVAVVVAARKRRIWGALLVLAAVVQLVEIPARPNVFDVQPLPPPFGEAWTGLRGNYRHLRVVPIQVQWVCGYNEALIGRLSQVAVREGLSINSGLVGRVPAAVGPLCNARFTGPVATDTVYVVDPNYMSDFHGAHCGALEGVPVCVAAGTVLAQRLTAVVP
ncbi:MAG: DUF6311 domain-containing protein [Myxococcales bacterium]|nr:DUF6311 domain-containing protein [Myxococcales bacterium]MDP3504318.1 DUF6311 domain-containing protein [Myxococcales bacterium]